jgi:hypothetical protein
MITMTFNKNSKKPHGDTDLGYGMRVMSYEAHNKAVPSVILGDGSTCIVTQYNMEHKVCGVSFGKSTRHDSKVGEVDVAITRIGESIATLSSDFQILTDNPASIDVLIDRLLEAKARLLSPDMEVDMPFNTQGMIFTSSFPNDADSEEYMEADLDEWLDQPLNQTDNVESGN